MEERYTLSFKQVNEARKLFDLEEEASLSEIETAFRRLSLKYHPDRCKNRDKKNCLEMFKKISNANDILMKYCAGYRYSFKEKDVKRNIMDKEYYNHLKRFYDGWLGNLDL